MSIYPFDEGTKRKADMLTHHSRFTMHILTIRPSNHQQDGEISIRFAISTIGIRTWIRPEGHFMGT